MFLMFEIRTMEERRAILEKNVKEIPGRIMLSEQKLLKVRYKTSFYGPLFVFYEMIIFKGASKTQRTHDGSD